MNQKLSFETLDGLIYSDIAMVGLVESGKKGWQGRTSKGASGSKRVKLQVGGKLKMQHYAGIVRTASNTGARNTVAGHEYRRKTWQRKHTETWWQVYISLPIEATTVTRTLTLDVLHLFCFIFPSLDPAQSTKSFTLKLAMAAWHLQNDHSRKVCPNWG